VNSLTYGRRNQVLYEALPGSAGERKLSQLGLDVPTIHDILLYGNAEAATYTDFDAPGAGEYARWSRHIRRASEILVPRGWARINPDNQPTLVHPKANWCFIVASGSPGTGVPYADPTTKNPKGRTFQQAVQDNVELALIQLAEMRPELAGLRETWVLLTQVNIHGEIQSEFSMPKNMDGEFISDWEHRILIPRIDPGAGPEGGAGEGGEEPPSYDFDIARK
jgi:hypothetical protein